MTNIFKIKKYRIITLCMMLLSLASFAQEYSDETTGFDAARITVTLKKRGMTDQNIQEEIALMRKLHNEQYAVMKKKENEQYAAMKKSEDAILRKITSEQALKIETNQPATNTGLTAKTASTTLVTDIPQTEKDALLALYNSTNGNNWINKTGWNFSTPVTSGWYGITVVGGHVTAINLSYNQLSGTLPSNIGQLTQLQSLQLNNNQLSGPIPSSIGQLTNAIRLYLHNNQLTGTIPSSIGQLTQIIELFLFNNQLSGTLPAAIGQLTQLQTLYLSVNQLSGPIPAEIGQLTKLTSLYLNQNQFSGTIPAEIGLLTKLTGLALHTNQLSGTIPAEIGQLTQLTTIFLGSNKLSGTIPASIGQLTQLQILSLYTNKLSGTIPVSIGQLIQLNTLYLNDNQLSGSIPAEIGQLTKLQSLSLNNNQLTGAIPPSIGQLTKLTILYLHNNQLNGTIPASIGQLTQLQILYLYINQLSGTIPTSIGQLTQLQNLQINNNQLTGTIPIQIGLLTKLSILYLHANQLSGTIPVEIGLLTKLTGLALHTNQLTGKIPVVIGQLTQLQALYLNTNQLTGTIPAVIGQLTQLQILTLYTNQLTGTIPQEIGLLTKLTTLHLHVNQLSGTIPSEIGQLTQLTSLYLNNNQLVGSIPNSIGNLTKLVRLYLHSNQLSGAIPAEIGQLTQAVELYLYNNKLNGAIPIQIGQLTKLTSLNLGTNQLSGRIPASIGQLILLQKLYLHTNQLSGTIPAEVGQLTQLQDLVLYQNQLSGTIPASIGQLTKLTTLYLSTNKLSVIPSEIGQLIKLASLYLSTNQLSGTIPAEIGQLTQLQTLHLNQNQLSGTIPASIGQLAQLQILNLNNNQLEGKIPDLTNVISNLNFQVNKFRFVDFASEHTAYKSKLTLFEYSNQAKTDSETTITKTAGETQTLTMYEDNRFTTADTYQWYKNGVAIAGATSRQYTLSNLTLANAGDYYCISKNPQMTIAAVTNQNLILTRNTIHLNVSNCNVILSSAIGTDIQTICNSAAITPITYTTAGLITGATFSGLPNGVTGNFASNIVTISGTPAYAGTFPYTVTYIGNCGSAITSKGTIAVQTKTVNAASSAPVVCKNTAIAPITHRTLGGILTVGTPSGLPSGVTAVWGLNSSSTTSGTLTISGTPTNSGVFNYSIPLLGGCGDTINAVGTITVSEPGTITLSSPIGTNDQSKNVNTIITPITYTTTGTTGATITGLPAGVMGTFASNTVTISGTPTASGTFTYLITLTGDCNTTITGKITALCEPITGIIKIKNELPVVSYPFQFSNSNSTSSEACAQTTFPLELYSNTPTLGVGSILYWNDKLTTVYNGSNLWYQESAAGMSYSIGNTGQIAQASGCLKSFWYKADDVVLSTEPNYVIYLTEGGTQARFDLSREESGNPCEEIRAVKIIRFYRVSPCTSTGIAFRFSNSGTVQSAVCNQTSFPNTFYADTTTLSVKTVLYSDANLTTPITITGTNAWFKNEENGTAYKVNSLGKIGLISYCGSSSSGTAYAYGVSSPGRDSSGLACSQTNFPNTFYAATSSLGIGSQMYSDSSLTSKMGGGDVWYKCLDPDVFYAFKLGTGGIVTAIVTCGGN